MIEEFVDKIDDFDKLKPSEMISYFAYYTLVMEKKDLITRGDIEKCFHLLHLKPYSNISSYLSSTSKGAKAIFNQFNGGYKLERKKFAEIKIQIDGNIKEVKPSSEILSLSILDNTRDYLKEVARQALVCYDTGSYDASFIMFRKLIESLIVELYEEHNRANEIKDLNSNNFHQLSRLINIFLADNSWGLSRNAKEILPKIKKFGDLSAHNRRFLADKSDIDGLKIEIRQVIQELILFVDYKS